MPSTPAERADTSARVEFLRDTGSPTASPSMGVDPLRHRRFDVVKPLQRVPRTTSWQSVDHATRDDRARPDGRQHGAPAPPRRTRLRGPRRRRGADRRTRGRTRRHRRTVARATWSQRWSTPRSIWIMVPAAFVGSTVDALGTVARRWRHDHRRRQLVVSPRRRPFGRTARCRHRLRRRRHQRRRVRPRAWLLPDDRRPRRRRRTAHTDLRVAGTRHRHRTTHPGPRRSRSTGGARLAALRAERRRALREDGPQRHRVRDDGRLRRGPQRARQGEHRRRRSCRRRRDRAARRRAVLPVRPRPRQGHRGVAPRVGDQFVAARPDRRGVPRRPRTQRLRGCRQRLGRGPMDGQRRDRRRRAGAGAVGGALSNGSRREDDPTWPTRCCRPCAPGSAATSNARTTTR